MKKGIVVEGDPLSSGGKVTQGSGAMVNGFKIALLGDPVSCPIPLHGGGTIIEGDPNYLDNGKPIALEGHKVSCGCTLLAKLVGGEIKLDFSPPAEPASIGFVDKMDRNITRFLENNSPQFLKDFNDTFKKSFCEIPGLNKKPNLPKPKNNPNHNPSAVLFDAVKELYCIDRSHYNENASSKNEQNKIVYKPLPGTPKDLICEKNLGGAHKNTTKPPRDGYESHHMPPKSAYKGSKMYPPGAKTSKDGPAIKITKADHEETQSYRRTQKSMEYQDMQKKLVQEGRFKEALQNDIDDLRRIAAKSGNPYRYECQIQQVIEYANPLDKSDFIIK